MHPNNIIHVVAGLIIQNNKILIGYRLKYKKWEFPGGKMEKGETPEQCLIREMNEELGIDCLIDSYIDSVFFSHENQEYVLAFYTITHFTGTPIAKEHSEIKWVSLKCLNNYDFFEPDRAIVDLLLNDRI